MEVVSVGIVSQECNVVDGIPVHLGLTLIHLGLLAIGHSCHRTITLSPQHIFMLN